MMIWRWYRDWEILVLHSGQVGVNGRKRVKSSASLPWLLTIFFPKIPGATAGITHLCVLSCLITGPELFRGEFCFSQDLKSANKSTCQLSHFC